MVKLSKSVFRHDRRRRLDADQRPGSRADVGPALFQRCCRDGAARVVRRGRDDVDRRKIQPARELRRKLSENGSRRDDRRQNRLGKIETAAELAVPLSGIDREHLRRRGVGPLSRHTAAQKVMKDVGHHQEPLRLAGPAPVVAVCEELKERVEGLGRDSGAGKNLLTRDNLEDPLRYAARALVAVADRLLEKTARAVEETVVDGPCVDSDACDPAPAVGKFGEAIDDFRKERRCVPALVTAGTRDRGREAMKLFQLELLSAEPPQDHPPASSPQIRGNVGARLLVH